MLNSLTKVLAEIQISYMFFGFKGKDESPRDVWRFIGLNLWDNRVRSFTSSDLIVSHKLDINTFSIELLQSLLEDLLLTLTGFPHHHF